MVLEVEYNRPFETNEHESLQNIIIKYVCYQIKSRYPQKLLDKISDQQAKMLRPHTTECQNDLEFKGKYISIGIATVYLPIQVGNLRKISWFEKYDNKFNKIYKLPVHTYKSLKNLNQYFIRIMYQNRCSRLRY